MKDNNCMTFEEIVNKMMADLDAISISLENRAKRQKAFLDDIQNIIDSNVENVYD